MSSASFASSSSPFQIYNKQPRRSASLTNPLPIPLIIVTEPGAHLIFPSDLIHHNNTESDNRMTKILEPLNALDQIILRKEKSTPVCCFQDGDDPKYYIMDQEEQLVLQAKENIDLDCCGSICCGDVGPSYINFVHSKSEQEAIYLVRYLSFVGVQSMHVQIPPGTVVGRVEHGKSICCPTYSVKKPGGEILFDIKGKCCLCFCGPRDSYKIFNSGVDKKQEVGMIVKLRSGLERDYCINFPSEATLHTKALLIGACILIDFIQS